MPHSSCGPISLPFFKLINPKLEKENSSEPLKAPALQKGPDVRLPQFLFCPRPPHLDFAERLFLCVLAVCVFPHP